jgi:hypothetical protein
MTLRKLKSFLYSWLLSKNKRIVPTTKSSTLTDFFSMIRPLNSGMPLIRLGAEGDGGYLVPDDLDGIEACFSPGVSSIATFELAFAERGIPCFLADFSVDHAPVTHSLIHFDKKFLGINNDDVYMRIDDWVKEKSPNSQNGILQMDIEGAEYEILFDISEEILKKFRIIIIEFHHLDKLMIEGEFKLLSLVFNKISRYFDVVHIHPNNCEQAYNYNGFAIPPIMEFTFLRKDRMLQRTQITSFPHPLDRKNVPDLEDVILPKTWWL